MNRFAALLDALSYEPRRNAKIALIVRYLRETPDPDRGWALAAMTGSLSFRHAKPAVIRELMASRTDPVLFGLSYDYVGDLSETVALLWPAPNETADRPPPALNDVIATLAQAGRTDMPRLLTGWLDTLDEAGRWALLKLITGALRIGVSARLAKTAVARLGDLEVDTVEQVWHGLKPPYEDLFAWAEGRGPRPDSDDPAPFRPPMLAHPIAEADFDRLAAADFHAEWKWDGIRVQAVSGRRADGTRVARLFSRSGDDISPAFPDIIEALDFDAAIDGELLIMRDGAVQPFNILQQRLNRKTVSAKMVAEYPAHLRGYDLLYCDGEDLRERTFSTRRAQLETLAASFAGKPIDLSPQIRFGDWEGLRAARAAPEHLIDDHVVVEGVMIKRAQSTYRPGRPKGEWFKWKRDPFIIDAVLLYAQRGHGKRSSYYSDYTFGVWRPAEAGGEELVPVGKAYFGFTDDELKTIDGFVRNNTVNRFGPVREVTHTAETGLVLEVAFEGLNRSKRHKSGVAMRFPRISRLRWDKKPTEADRLVTLEALLPDG